MITEYSLSTAPTTPGRPTKDVCVYLLRHGETDLNALGVLQGSIEAPLNTKGEQQAQQAASHLINRGITRIVSSPQLRARQTASAVAEKLNLTIEENPLLRERDWGIHEGKPRSDRSDEGAGVEPYTALSQRAQLAFNDITSGLTEPCLMVSHSGLIKALLKQIVGNAPDVIHNGEVIKITL